MLTAHRLREKVNYDPATGVFTHRASQRPVRAGDEAGWVASNGYRYLTVDYETHTAQRLAWLYMTGVWPKGVVDHKNRTPTDNRWANLRDVSQSVNMMNVGIRATNTSGYPGVCWSKQHGRWKAQIKIGYKNHHLGLFDTLEEAYVAYSAAREKHLIAS